MQFTASSPSRWYSLIMLLVMLTLIQGPIHPQSAGAALETAEPLGVGSRAKPAAADAAGGTSGGALWHERLAKIKSAQELMEKNKILPTLHEQYTGMQSVEVVATGYYAGRESTGKSPEHPEYGITYSGVQVRRDIFSTIAADPKVFPIGTILWIPGYGYGIVADTGSAIKGRKIDLYYETKQQVFQEWGKRQVNVFVIRQGNGKLTESMLKQLNGVLEVAGDTAAAVRYREALGI